MPEGTEEALAREGGEGCEGLLAREGPEGALAPEGAEGCEGPSPVRGTWALMHWVWGLGS